MLLHKLRRATVAPERAPLRDVVEVDETYVGGPEEGVVGREVETKVLVGAAVEVRGRAAGRVRLQVVPDAPGPALTGFVRAVVAPGPRSSPMAGAAMPP